MPIVGQFASLARAGSFLLPGGAFESIATVTVGSGGASSITFSDIPGTYQHLQLRMLYRNTSNNGGSSGSMKLWFNTDTATNYTYHLLYGNGSSVTADGSGTGIFGYIPTGTVTLSTYLASSFSATVLDIIDYASTSKNKTVRNFSGRDHNGSGLVLTASGLWLSTAAISTVNLAMVGNDFAQYSTAALYGIKAP